MADRLVDCIDCLDGAESCICDDDEFIVGDGEYIGGRVNLVRDALGRQWLLETIPDKNGAMLTREGDGATTCICFDL